MPMTIGGADAWRDEKLDAMFLGAVDDEYPFCHTMSFEFPSLESIWGNGYSDMDWQLDAYLSTLLDVEPNSSVIQGDFCIDRGDLPGASSVMGGSAFQLAEQAEAELEGKLSDDRDEELVVADKRPNLRTSSGQENYGRGRLLSMEEISLCFYMPINQAAKELNIGITQLKKRCRELGIKRWPHRKLASLTTLIDNIRELREQKDGEKVREAVELLERERRLMEEVPDLKLKDKTKRLRQACFKANYKKRKQMGAIACHP
ncbi:hypothetical protein MLD38_031920 [Melastoma candidum]|uniref:Uncharacterized protein n=1 Tax=Melastoma candidum TaxID=119954 RepID=A0ACB9MSY1_9MYRT|nr:hypothetical protein MLD38_031920 [Melastoma candidum]